MRTRTLFVTLFAALTCAGTVLGAARATAAPDPTDQLEASRLSLSIEEWLGKLGVLPQPRASESPAGIGAPLRLPALSLLEEATHLTGSLCQWFSPENAACVRPDRSPRVATGPAPGR